MSKPTDASPRRTPRRILSERHRAELTDCLSVRVTRALVFDIENALRVYAAYRTLQRAGEREARNPKRLACVRAARTLLRSLPPEPAYDALREQLTSAAARWQRPKHRPSNQAAKALRILVMDALITAGVVPRVTHNPRRNTEAMEVIRLVMRWADQLDGQPARERRDVYRLTKHARDLVQRGGVAGLFSVRDGLLTVTYEEAGTFATTTPRPALLVRVDLDEDQGQ